MHLFESLEGIKFRKKVGSHGFKFFRAILRKTDNEVIGLIMAQTLQYKSPTLLTVGSN